MAQQDPSTLELHYAFTSATQAFLDSEAGLGLQDIRRSSTISCASYNQSTPPTSHFSPSQVSSATSQSHSQYCQSSRPLYSRRDEENQHPVSFSIGAPPMLADLCEPGTDFHSPPAASETRPPPSPHPYSPGLATPYHIHDMGSEEPEEVDEEISRASFPPLARLQFKSPAGRDLVRTTSPAPSPSSSSSSSESAKLVLFRAPQECPASSDALIYRFSVQTSGILSIRNGKTENPWRELIWPLAKDCPALYHAITYMSALQGAQYDKQSRGGTQVQLLKITGVRHMQQSIKKLYEGLKTMSLDAALATSLALALGEGWDDNPSTGILHLKGAKLLIQNALLNRDRNLVLVHFNAENAQRLKFLCNTFVYLDVIARLTSKEPQEDFEFTTLLTMANQHSNGKSIEVDPLMGCATTLFPIIGQVATLVQKVRDPASRISLLMIEEAGRLRELLEQWQPPDVGEIGEPEDPDLAVQDAIYTAESYRLATLLYLYQGVPEVASESTSSLARRILQTIMKVRDNSQIIIIQIFPLLVGSCEMTSSDDRVWVRNRWSTMIRRLTILNVESCWKLVQEVWKRRDLYTVVKAQNLPLQQFTPHVMAPKLKRKMYSADDVSSEQEFFGELRSPWREPASDPPSVKRRLTSVQARSVAPTSSPLLVRRHTEASLPIIEPEYTVRGGLHWLSVMYEWNWEGWYLVCTIYLLTTDCL